MSIARVAALEHGVLGLLDDSQGTAAAHHQRRVVRALRAVTEVEESRFVDMPFVLSFVLAVVCRL